MSIKRAKSAHKAPRGLQKAATGIQGLDEITGGGLPRGRATLVCGGAGCGKTMLAAEFLVRGAVDRDEPGVFVMFEENAAELTENLRSLGFDLDKLQRQKKIAIDYVHIERSEIEETGEYDLEGLFIRLSHAIDSVGARRVVLDTLEALFAGLPNHAVLRAELRRLFRWLKDRGMTVVITGESIDARLTRFGLEEYVADCVIVLDHRINDQISTRRLRVLKYRGSDHGTNEYPFVIAKNGISVLPITSLGLNHDATNERVTTGIKGLDEMLGDLGVYRGSSVLVSGAPGTGKSSLGATFANAACVRGERAMFFSYEESPRQLFRNMASIGLDLGRWERKALLQIHVARPTLYGLEQHLLLMHDAVLKFRPAVVVVDPISNLTMHRQDASLRPALMRLIDFLKQQGITALFTSLTSDNQVPIADSEIGVSSLMDTWILLANLQLNGERTRTLQLLKSRGMAHSNKIREFIFSETGIDLVDIYHSRHQVLTGAARISHEAQERAARELRERDHHNRLQHLAVQRKAIDAQIAALNADMESRASEVQLSIERECLDAGVQLGHSDKYRISRQSRSSRKQRSGKKL